MITASVRLVMLVGLECSVAERFRTSSWALLHAGKLLDAWMTKGSKLSDRRNALPAGFTAGAFSKLYDMPLCSLFSPSTARGFSGHCEALPKTCSDPQQWCHGDGDQNNGAMVVQELMAGQLATSLFGWAGGLFTDQQQMLDAADDEGVKNLLSDYTPGRSAASGRASHVLLCVTVQQPHPAKTQMVLISIGLWPSFRCKEAARRFACGAGATLNGRMPCLVGSMCVDLVQIWQHIHAGPLCHK